MHQRYGLKKIEVTDEVFEPEASIALTQAESRINTIEAAPVSALA